MFKQILLATMATFTSAAPTDYRTLGANWGDTYPLCKTGSYQSPIDLSTKAKKVPYKEDRFFKHYEDVETAKTSWLGPKYTA